MSIIIICFFIYHMLTVKFSPITKALNKIYVKTLTCKTIKIFRDSVNKIAVLLRRYFYKIIDAESRFICLIFFK